MSDVFAGGFADVPVASARAFREALEALARPGERRRPGGAAPPAPMSPAAGALLLTLADPDTPVWLAPALAGAAPWVVFHTGAPVTTARTAAAFAVGGWADLLPLEDWPSGTPDYPDRSATLIVEVPALVGGPVLALEGPGIPGRRRIAPRLPAGAGAELAANAARFPLGVDLFLVAGEEAIGLPRSTRTTPED